MDDEGSTLDDASIDKLRKICKFVDAYGDRLLSTSGTGERRRPIYLPPIRGWLLQDLGGSEVAMLAEAVRRPSVHSFVISLYGLWDLTSFQFRLRITVPTGPTFTTAPIGVAGVATAADVKQAILLAAGFQADRVHVNLGNPAFTTIGVANSLGTPSINNGIVSYPTATWHVTFDDFENQLGLELSVLDVNGGLLSGNSIIISLRTYDVPNGTCTPVFDPLELPLKAPIRRGSKVIAMWYPDTGYGIVSGNARDFKDFSGNNG